MKKGAMVGIGIVIAIAIAVGVYASSVENTQSPTAEIGLEDTSEVEITQPEEEITQPEEEEEPLSSIIVDVEEDFGITAEQENP